MTMTKLKKILSASLLLLSFCVISAAQTRSETLLRDWQFRQGHELDAADGWTDVKIPHDWAIYGPFDRSNDLQTVAVIQNGENEASAKTGRTGGLPYVGRGTYRCTVDIDGADASRILLFDGAMSEARVFVNGREVCFWPYGYNSFYCNIDDALQTGRNTVAVQLENRPQSSRWYPGAGLFRKVRLLTVPKRHIPVWGVYVTTPYVSKEYALVRVRTEMAGCGEGETLEFRSTICGEDGNVLATRTDRRCLMHGAPAEQNITLERPELWSPENPAMYVLRTEVLRDGEIVDACDTRFGVRSIELRADKGFFLNGKELKFKGVCLHHDLGPLGAAVNKSAIRHQLAILKDMGCNAIRTSHNMPAEELVELCDEMGFMMMVEPFDEWDVAKCDNGYHRWFNVDSGNGVSWAERDMVNMLRHFRNNPSVVMWSIGNEVPTQWTPGGYEVASFLQDICHREDPTRPVTCGMDQFDAVVNNGFAAILDVPGFNYKPHRYQEAYDKLPQNLILGSESSSTVSSRGVYHFPMKRGYDLLDADHQCSSYDVEHCFWSNIPDVDFAADEDLPWCIGQFVWTGFDYLGEPSPYDTDAWPNHSSMFGIMDLASLPKDRYWFYRSIWRPEVPTLHLLPHWTWKGMKGESIPVIAYSSYPEVELFVNGRSIGRKSRKQEGNPGRESVINVRLDRFRFVWEDVAYEPGELRAVAYDADGSVAEDRVIRTAGKPYALQIENGLAFTGCEGLPQLEADGSDLAYLTVKVVDKDGNLCPDAAKLISFEVSGAGSFEAVANGDPCCLESFREPHMSAFHGMLTVIVRAGETGGALQVSATAKGLKPASATLEVR